MKSRYIRLSSLKFFAMLLGAFGLLLIYALPAFKELAARSAYQRFIAMTADKADDTITSEQLDRATAMLERAARYERRNPRWSAERGNFLHRIAAASQDPVMKARQQQRFQEAEASLKQTVMRDPANAWNLYELGRLEISRGNCSTNEGTLNARCQAGALFAAAIRFAPNSVFLRTIIGGWYASHDKETALRLIYDMVQAYPQHLRSVLEFLWPTFPNVRDIRIFVPDTQEHRAIFARFLYDQRQDYASDLERRRAFPDENTIDCAAQVHPRGDILEIGNDDGTAEWRSYLAFDDERIKKDLCLPENIAEYREATLQLFLSSGYPGDCTVLISIDDTLIRQFGPRELPYETGWISIEFPPVILYGKQRISVYLRTMNATSENGKYVNVWGDADAPTRTSVFVFDTTDDLSREGNAQTGEYMIRLTLRK